jgi:hypothetical protein
VRRASRLHTGCAADLAPKTPLLGGPAADFRLPDRVIIGCTVDFFLPTRFRIRMP